MEHASDSVFVDLGDGVKRELRITIGTNKRLKARVGISLASLTATYTGNDPVEKQRVEDESSRRMSEFLMENASDIFFESLARDRKGELLDHNKGISIADIDAMPLAQLKPVLDAVTEAMRLANPDSEDETVAGSGA